MAGSREKPSLLKHSQCTKIQQLPPSHLPTILTVFNHKRQLATQFPLTVGGLIFTLCSGGPEKKAIAASVALNIAQKHAARLDVPKAKLARRHCNLRDVAFVCVPRVASYAFSTTRTTSERFRVIVDCKSFFAGPQVTAPRIPGPPFENRRLFDPPFCACVAACKSLRCVAGLH